MNRHKAGYPDIILVLVVLTLLAFSIVMVYSSSAILSLWRWGHSYYYLQRQGIWIALGLPLMFMLSRVPYWKWHELANIMLAVTVVLLLLVFVPGIGMEFNESNRWIGVGSLTFQPSELAKLVLVIYLAHLLSIKGSKIKDFFRGLVPPLTVTGVICLLILAEPDLGTAIAIGGGVFLMLFIAGARIEHLFFLGVATVPAVFLAIFAEPYRKSRFLAFLHPWDDPTGTGWHIIQSLYAIGSGHLLGLGLGQSRQKHFYLPEPQTDFIFSVIAEELGFLGGLVVIGLLVLFVWRGYRIAITAPDMFSTLLAAGITTMLALQIVINLGVVTGSMPITGIPLPFVSFGGTSLLYCLSGTGILLNISRYCD